MNPDFARALRQAGRQPGLTMALAATVAVATAAVVVVGSIVDRVLIRPLPFSAPERVVGVWFRSPNFPGGLTRVRQSKATFLHLKQQSQVFERIALAEEASVTWDLGSRGVRIRVAQVTSELFEVLGVPVIAGRPLRASDHAPGAEPVVVVTEGAWRRRLGADPAVVGSVIRMDGVPRRVAGVLPAGTRFPSAPVEAWIPITIDTADLGAQDFVYTAYGRMKPGVTEAALQDDMGRAIERLPDAYPQVFPRPLVKRLQLTGLFVPLLDEVVGPVRRPLVLGLAATAVLLLLVAANLGNLHLIRQDRRHLDLVVRSALGAPPRRIRTMVVIDSLLPSLGGGLAGLLGAAVVLVWIRDAGVSVLPRAAELSLSPVTALVSLLVVTSAGAVAALGAASAMQRDALGALRGGGRTAPSRLRARLPWMLAAAQVAMAVVSATGAGLMVRSVGAITAVNPGFTADGLSGARLFLPPSDYVDFNAVSGFYRNLMDDVRATPGVEAASLTAFLPLRDGRLLYPYRIEGDPRENPLPTPHQTKWVFDQYFAAMGIPLVAGRPIDRYDLDAGTDIAVVNAALAAAYWPGTDAIGKRLRSDADGPWLTVVGVVGDVRDRSLTDPAPPIVYLPYQKRHALDRRLREMSVVVRTRTGVNGLSAIEHAVAARDPLVPVSAPETMAAIVRASTAATRHAMQLTVFTAVAALVLAGIGLYAVLSNSVSSRLREVAIRSALGASRADIRRALLGRVALAMAAGGAVGALLAVFTGRLAAGLLFGVRPFDPITITAVVALVGVTGWAATIGPAKRALSHSPATLLRSTFRA